MMMVAPHITFVFLLSKSYHENMVITIIGMKCGTAFFNLLAYTTLYLHPTRLKICCNLQSTVNVYFHLYIIPLYIIRQ